MCHGPDLKATGPLAKKSNLPTPDLTTPAFKNGWRLIRALLCLRSYSAPNGDLIPNAAREWGEGRAACLNVKDLRDLNEYMSGVISKS